MSRESTNRATRMRGGSWIAGLSWAVPVLGVAALLDGVLRPPAQARPVDRVSFVVLMSLLTWFGWLVAQTDARMGPAGLTVTNLGRRWEIPWSAIGQVDADREVVVVLRSGQRVRLLGAGGSLIGVLLGSRHQQHLIDLVESRRTPAGAGPVDASSGWRLHLLPATTATALLAAVAWLHG